MAAAALCVLLVPALAQDNPAPSRIAMPATGAYPLRQDSTQLLGSNLIGAKVMSITNESIGRISNLIVNENGAVEAAVISVGGFFGIRHKDVAVTFKSLNIMRNRTADAIDHVTLAATQERSAAGGRVQAAQAEQARTRRRGGRSARPPP